MTGLTQAIDRALRRSTPSTFTPTAWAGTIKGELASAKNSRRMVPRRSRKGRTYLAPIKSEKAQGWLGDAMRQVIGRTGQAIECDVVLTATLYYASRRPDLDESLMMDFLQLAGIIKNDRQIKAKHIYWALDKADPRVEIDVRAA